MNSDVSEKVEAVTSKLFYFINKNDLLPFDKDFYTLEIITNELSLRSKIDILPTMSQFSRTYGFKIYYIDNGKTEMINNVYSKFDTRFDALLAGLELVCKLIDDNVIKKIPEVI